MNLKELTESYEEYTLTEAYLTEGLRIFKESKKLYTIASKITSKLSKIEKTGSAEAVAAAKKLAADITKLGDEYKKVEDDFAGKKLDKTTATAKLKALKNSNDSISGYIKSAKTKSLLGKIGLGVVITGLGVLLGSIAMNPSLLNSIASGVQNFAAAASAKIGSFFGKKDVEKAIPGAAQRSRDAPAPTRSTSETRAASRSRSTPSSSPRMGVKFPTPKAPKSSLRQFADDNMDSMNY